jgi:hypothetical protein
MDRLKLFTLKYEFLKYLVELQTALAAEAHRAEGATKRDVTNVPSRNWMPLFRGQRGNI